MKEAGRSKQNEKPKLKTILIPYMEHFFYRLSVVSYWLNLTDNQQ